jgi:pimeloyl-ACP methyl ester carboxylesterase
MNIQDHIAKSADSVSIHYDVRGDGTPVLIFVHGWCCDRHYWDQQVDHFAAHYTVVRVDLAGHGVSGQDRAQWTMEAFGQDVVAVVEDLGLERVVLIGHSMGGAVIIEAAKRLPGTVIGLVGADTWSDLGHAMTPAELAEFLVPFRTDVVEAIRALIPTAFVPTSDPTLVQEVVRNMSAISPQVGLGAWEELLLYDRVMQERLQAIAAPKVAINADWRPTDVDAAQYCGVQVMLMSGVGHFLMMEDPRTFNRLLDEAVKKLVQPGPLQ